MEKEAWYGYIPNTGTVFPQKENIFFLNAAAMCMIPVSWVKTTYASLMREAD